MKSNIIRIVLPVLSVLIGIIGTATPGLAYADGMCICLDPPGCTQYVCPDGSTQPSSSAQTLSASQSPSASQSSSGASTPSEQDVSGSAYEGSDAFYDSSKTRGVDLTGYEQEGVFVFNFGIGVTGGVFLPDYMLETKQSALDNVVGNVDATLTLGFMYVGGSRYFSMGFLVDQHLGFAALSGKVSGVPQDKFFLGITDCLFTFNIFPVNDVFFEMGVGAGFSYSDFFFGMTIPLKIGVVWYLNDYLAMGVSLIIRDQIALFGDVDSEDYEMGGVISHYPYGIQPMIQFIYRPNANKYEVFRHLRYGD